MIRMAAPTPMYMIASSRVQTYLTSLTQGNGATNVRAEGFEPPVGFRRRIKSPIPSSSSVRPPKVRCAPVTPTPLRMTCTSPYLQHRARCFRIGLRNRTAPSYGDS